ncbi:hypothetical protein DYB25_002063 [Aphanomyces astaci]|uniref:Phospholipid/glycerol acyltransferase domain-containing protein n=1 Tax=Aphanomyces astaci TaxID=112090 RepID=A0A397BRK6_APHAT|nr:hypothetical protein DYB25_002063 [Aphanomyces astaci]RHY58652.1 hypothetical protein DYB34_000631 [Aphanomyces astaci]RHZ38684.1 hypothetical protein DYB26_013475 [Aphanomyces astaci]
MWQVYAAVVAVVVISVAVFMIYYEEKKHFANIAHGKILLFGLFWVLVSALQFALVLPLKLVLAPNELHIVAHETCQVVARSLHVLFFGPVVVEGRPNANPDETMMDITSLYFLGGNFSWVSKSIIFLIPGAGWLMKLANYVPLTRKNKTSVLRMFELARDRFANGWSVVVFPQGTRRRTEFLPFKDGAFDLAIGAKVRVLPVTIIIPDDLWTWNRLGKVKLVIGKPIAIEDGMTREQLKQKAFDVVLGNLPKEK